MRSDAALRRLMCAVLRNVYVDVGDEIDGAMSEACDALGIDRQRIDESSSSATACDVVMELAEPREARVVDEERLGRARAVVGRLGAAFCRSPEAQASCSTCQAAIRVIAEALRAEAAAHV